MCPFLSSPSLSHKACVSRIRRVSSAICFIWSLVFLLSMAVLDRFATNFFIAVDIATLSPFTVIASLLCITKAFTSAIIRAANTLSLAFFSIRASTSFMAGWLASASSADLKSSGAISFIRAVLCVWASSWSLSDRRNSSNSMPICSAALSMLAFMATIFCTSVSISRMVGISGPNQFKMPDVGIVFSVATKVGGAIASRLSFSPPPQSFQLCPFTTCSTPSAMPLVEVDFWVRRIPGLMLASAVPIFSLFCLVVLGREYLGMYLDMLGWGSLIGSEPSGAYAASC